MNDSQTKSKAATSYLDQVMTAGGTEAVSSTDSLSSALKVGFDVLKILMVVLAVVFCFSNVYWVPEGYVAVQTRFGRIIGKNNDVIRQPGGPYLAFPYPLDKIVRIPTNIQKIAVFKAFWSETDESEPLIDDRPESEHLRPGINGSLVTADKNIVQGIWVIHYKLDTRNGKKNAPTDFVRHVGTMPRAGEIIRLAAQSAIVRVVSQTNVADFIAGQIDNQAIQRIIAAQLDRCHAGLTITGVTASQYAVPKVLMREFEAVNQAESQKALAIEKASRRRVSTLNELAGSGWQELLSTIEAHEKAIQKNDSEAEQGAFNAVRDLFMAGEIGGAVKQMLDEARGDKTATIQRARAAATRFNELLPAYKENGEVLRRQLTQDTIREIWSEISVEALYVPPGQKLFLDLGRPNQVKE